MDLFEDLKSQLGCRFVSDLRFEPYSSKAKLLLSEMDLSKYTLSELRDAAWYFYQHQMPFASINDAIYFF